MHQVLNFGLRYFFKPLIIDNLVIHIPFSTSFDFDKSLYDTLRLYVHLFPPIFENFFMLEPNIVL